MNIKSKLFLFSILISISSLSFAVDNGTWTYDINSDDTSITLTGCSDFVKGKTEIDEKNTKLSDSTL